MIRLLAFLPLAAALTGFAYWVYARRELPVRRARTLATLRAASLLILLALLFDPVFPGSARGGSAARWVLLDASLSMAAEDASGTSAWSQASARADALEGEGWTVVGFGDGVGGARDRGPVGGSSELAPALQRAAEAGAREVRVLSDLRFDDAVRVRAVLDELPLTVTFESFGLGVANAGVAGLEIADAADRGAPVTAEVVLLGTGPGDSATVELREEGRLVATAVAPLPGPGLTRRIRVELPAPAGQGWVRYTASLTSPDGFAEDDEAVAYAAAGHDEGSLVLVSLEPDWEPRYLLPVLEEATGLEALGFLRVGADRFVPMGRAAERGGPVDSAGVGRTARDAALLVVHGLSASTDGWGRGLTRSGGRVLAWPLDPEGARELGLQVGAPRAGEWYASTDPPPSELAADLAGAAFAGLPPLAQPLLLQEREGLQLPLSVQLGGTGPGEPALVLVAERGRRLAAPLARDFWRWAARDGGGRDAYRRLWSGVAGWLLAPDPAALGGELRPRSRVVPRGEPVAWRVPEGDPRRLTVRRGDETVLDTLLEGGDLRTTGPLDPGSYEYSVAAGEGGTPGGGRFDVARTVDEMVPAAREPETLEAGRPALGRGGAGGTPLRTRPWPYLAVLTLLGLEWIGRRRAGLR